MALVLGYGALDYFILSKKAPAPTMQPGKSPEEIQAFAASSSAILAKLSQESGSNLKHLILKSEASWNKDPFYKVTEIEMQAQKQEQGLPQGVEVIYSGFIKAGRNILAVINGMEYNIGEELLELGYRVICITPEAVRLWIGENHEVTIPLEEN